jgi:hypothetical protein
MPYVKISDPNIIDVAAWHQVINVVNQHSDSINAITNNFGVQGSGVVNWNGENDVVHEFTPGSQKMLYGRNKLDTADMESTTGDHTFYFDVDFADPVSGTGSFSARPIVTATISFGSTVTPPPVTNANIVCTIMAITKDNFRVRVTAANSLVSKVVKLTGFFYVNWTAIGPK